MLQSKLGTVGSDGILARYRAIRDIRANPQFSDEAKGIAYGQIKDGVPLEKVFADLQASVTHRALQEA